MQILRFRGVLLDCKPACSEADIKTSPGNATPQHLEETLTVLWEAAQQLDHGPAIVYTLLAKVCACGHTVSGLYMCVAAINAW